MRVVPFFVRHLGDNAYRARTVFLISSDVIHLTFYNVHCYYSVPIPTILSSPITVTH